MPTSSQLHWIEAELDILKAQAQHRQLKSAVLEPGGYVRLNGRRLLNLSSNNYLGLAEDLNVRDLVCDRDFAAGATASRLIVGNHPDYTDMESEVAAHKRAPAGLTFGSGYLANIGIIPALVGRGDAVYSDRLNHASIVDGIRISGAKHNRYRHRDLEHLESMLSDGQFRRRLIVSDSLFSMDGDLAPLERLVEMKDRYNAMLMVDEAHSGGIYGDQGAGLTQALGLSDDVDVQMGTFSKAYGCYGAYVCGSQALIEYLINRARSVIYTTGLPPMLVAVIRRAVHKVATEEWRRRRLCENATFFRAGLEAQGFNLGASETHIISMIVGANESTLEISDRLLSEGIAAVAIRPPTVPPNTARLRFSVTAAHRREDLERAVAVIASAAC